MDLKQFLQACKLINANLVNQAMDRTFNSAGSNVFFEFGKQKEFLFPSGKKGIEKEWALWVSWASWRISQHNKYIVGSGDQNISICLRKLLGKHFQSFQFISQFLDAEFNFENGYQITTFFNRIAENQWLFFLPNEMIIKIDCSTQEAIKKTQDLAKYCLIKKNYKTVNLPHQNVIVERILYDNINDLPVFICQNDISIYLTTCTWRLEKKEKYYIGYLDEDKNEIRTKLSELIGKKLEKLDIVNSMMDARFQFEDQYVLKTFTCCRAANQWNILYKGDTFFSGKIEKVIK